MKLVSTLSILIGLIILISCGGKAPSLPFAEDSEQFAFFQTVNDSLNLTYLNPEKPTALITTNDFTVWSFDVMPGVYSRFSRFKDSPQTIPAQQLKETVMQGAQGEAEKRLILAQAEKANFTVDDSTVDGRMEQIYQSRGGKEAFVNMLEERGFTLEFVQQDVRDQMTLQEFLDQELLSRLQVTDEDLEKAYSEDKTATVRHILFMTRGKSEEEKAEIKAKAEQVLARARAGEDFVELVKQFSEDEGSVANGGLYTEFERGRMVKPFEEAAFELPIDTISDLVETTYGYHIIKIIDRQKETKPFEEVKDSLSQKLQQTKRRDVYNSYLDELKENANYQENFAQLS